jgi:hypothetical protein
MCFEKLRHRGDDVVLSTVDIHLDEVAFHFGSAE